MVKVTIHHRAKSFSISIVRLIRDNRKFGIEPILYNQLVRSATSIGANIIEAQHASSKKEFLRYMQIALRSARETEYWMDICKNTGILTGDASTDLHQESKELSKILSTILINGKKSG